MDRTVKIDGRPVRLKASALTLLIYEDRFKGRRLLQDMGEIVKITDTDKAPLSVYARILWSTAKTADETLPDIYEWTKDFSISGIMQASKTAYELVCGSFNTKKKVKATAIRKGMRRLMTFCQSH